MGFQYGGVSSQSMKVKARLTGWQASPSVRSNTETVPGKPGLADFGADSGERYIDISCNVFPQKTFAALVSVLDRVSAWLDPTQGLKQLILDDVPDWYFQARLSDTVDCERLLRAAGSFSLRFLCPDPYGYALDDEAFVLTGTGAQEVVRLVGNTYCPIFNTRQGPGQPVIYLSLIRGKPRLMLYNSSGSLILDESVTPPFSFVNNGWYFIAAVIEPDNKRAFYVVGDRGTGTVWTSAALSWTGELNRSCVADLVMGMHAEQYYYAGGFETGFWIRILPLRRRSWRNISKPPFPPTAGIWVARWTHFRNRAALPCGKVLTGHIPPPASLSQRPRPAPFPAQAGYPSPANIRRA